jgi:hypothetical protein
LTTVTAKQFLQLIKITKTPSLACQSQRFQLYNNLCRSSKSFLQAFFKAGFLPSKAAQAAPSENKL